MLSQGINMVDLQSRCIAAAFNPSLAVCDKQALDKSGNSRALSFRPAVDRPLQNTEVWLTGNAAHRQAMRVVLRQLLLLWCCSHPILDRCKPALAPPA